MLANITNVLLIVVFVVGIGGGVALFVIAKQDDSRVGRLLGAAMAIVLLSAAIYLTWGDHWL